MPDGSATLIINLAEDEVRGYIGSNDDQLVRHPGAVLVGAGSRYSVIDSQEQRAVMGVAFRPGGTWPFFDPAADELRNQDTPLQDIWRCGGASLRERVLSGATPLARIGILERELLAQSIRPLERRPEIDLALASLIRTHGNIAITEVSEQTGMNMRSLSRAFTVEVGLTPKLFARIKRFERMLALICNGKPIEWRDIALECGYFDQSHLIRDCKLISGCSPVELLSRRSGSTNHIAI